MDKKVITDNSLVKLTHASQEKEIYQAAVEIAIMDLECAYIIKETYRQHIVEILPKLEKRIKLLEIKVDSGRGK